MDKLNKLSLPATIIIASVVLGGFYFASEYMKQQSNERQQVLKLIEDRRIEDLKVEQEKAAEKARQLQLFTNKQLLDGCLKNADDNYQTNFESYCMSEGRGANCTSIRRVNADAVEAIEKNEKADCFKKYPQ